tara:strand:+ start:1856 stop:2716 length:861 start_codon:yes stop_codon:yes gene_type:complete
MNISVNFSNEIRGSKDKKTLNKPFRTSKGPKKFSVYVKNEKGNIVKVNFGDPNMEIKRDDPARRKSFRARMKCDTSPGPRWKANYWSCKMWESKKSVTDYTSKGGVDDVVHQWDGITLWEESDLLKLSPHLAQAEEIPEEIETQSEDVNEEVVEMAMAQLAYISDYSKDLLDKLRANPKMSEEIEPWVQSKITIMEDYLFSIYNYLIYSQKEEENKNIIEAGMRILNINPSCKHYNSEGIVKEIKDLPDDMGKIIAYEVINDGADFKKGDTLTKTIDQIKILEGNK